jgi:type IV pilus assembly protein PilQ
MMRALRNFQVLVFLFTLSAFFLTKNLYAIETGSSFVLPAFSKKVSLDFKAADLKDVLKALSQQIGMNFLLSSDVNVKEVTVFLENVPVEEALDMILSANDLTYEMRTEVNTIVVSARPKDGENLVTRIYQLKYATVSSSKLNGTISIGTDTSGASTSSGSSSSSSSSSGSSGTASTGGGLKQALEGVISKEGKVVEDARTNSLIITDSARYFPQVEKVLARLDVPVPQILIEIEMLDVSKTLLDDMGLKFSGNTLTIDASKFNFPVSDGASRYNHIFEFFKKGDVTTGLNAVLDFLKTKTDTKSLARPRILTLDNEKAQIKISTDEAIGAKTTSTGSGDTSETTIEADRATTGVIFTVTPQANLMTGEVTMAISPRVIEAKTGGTFKGETFKDPEERGIDVMLKAKNGQTVVIGGLLRSEKSVTITKLPVFGDLPLLGTLFRHHATDVKERELLIVVTPHILGLDDMPIGKYSPMNNLIDLDREQSTAESRSSAIGDQLDDLSGSRRE